MRFHRNAGARGEAEWMCLTPSQSKVFCYARVVLAKNVTFEIAGLDGWALGDLRWLACPYKVADDAIWPLVRPDALARLPVNGWSALRFRKREGFFTDGGRRVLRARAILLGPSVSVVWRPTTAE
jgi:hypothetical protein